MDTKTNKLKNSGAISTGGTSLRGRSPITKGQGIRNSGAVAKGGNALRDNGAVSATHNGLKTQGAITKGKRPDDAGAITKGQRPNDSGAITKNQGLRNAGAVSKGHNALRNTGAVSSKHNALRNAGVVAKSGGGTRGAGLRGTGKGLGRPENQVGGKGKTYKPGKPKEKKPPRGCRMGQPAFGAMRMLVTYRFDDNGNEVPAVCEDIEANVMGKTWPLDWKSAFFDWETFDGETQTETETVRTYNPGGHGACILPLWGDPGIENAVAKVERMEIENGEEKKLPEPAMERGIWVEPFRLLPF